MLSSDWSSSKKRSSSRVTGRFSLLLVACSIPLWLGCSSDEGTTTSTDGIGTGGSNAGAPTAGGAAMSGASPGNPTAGGAAMGGAFPDNPTAGGAATGGSSAPTTGGTATGGQAASGAGAGGIAKGGQTAGGTGGTGEGGPLTGDEGGSSAGGESAEGGQGDGSAEGGQGDGSAEGGQGGGSAEGGEGGEGAGSPGCGSANPLTSSTINVDIDGTARQYILDVPTGYDPNTPYRLIFVWHPLGGHASQVAGNYDGLKPLANNSTIFVAPEGLDGSNAEASGNGWWNVNNVDMKLFEAMFENITSNLCVDQDRIFSTGFSFGGMMSYTIGYEFDVFRAVAPCSGKVDVIPFEEKFTRPLPIMAFHGDSDTFVATALGRAFLDKYRERNNCGSATQPVDPSPCVEFQDCEVPTMWCEFPGAHNPWSEEPQAIWNFFSQF